MLTQDQIANLSLVAALSGNSIDRWVSKDRIVASFRDIVGEDVDVQEYVHTVMKDLLRLDLIEIGNDGSEYRLKQSGKNALEDLLRR